jgi:hypothetical protein
VTASAATPQSVARAPAVAAAPTAEDAPTPAAQADPDRAAAEADPDRAAAASRALLALASAAGPHVVKPAQDDAVRLDVPWRGDLVDPSGAEPTMDGIAALGIILETFGVSAGNADLQALAETWQPGPSGSPIGLDTFARIAQRGSLRSLGPFRGPGGGEWTAELARYYLRRGYPVLARVQSALLTDPTQPSSSPPSSAESAHRYIVLIGFEGEELLYHDPSTPDGVARRVLAADLDRAWEAAVPPQQGAAFGFGANVIGLFDLTSQPVAATAAPATPAGLAAAQLTTESAVAPPAPAPSGGIHPALLAFMVILIGGSGFVAIRLLR